MAHICMVRGHFLTLVIDDFERDLGFDGKRVTLEVIYDVAIAKFFFEKK